MKVFSTRYGMRSLIGLVGLCALLFWAIKVSRESRPSYLYSKWLIDEDASRRVHAAQELGDSDVETAIAVPALLRAVRTDDSAPVRERSVRSLIKLLRGRKDDPVVEAVISTLVDALADVDPTVRTAVADALAEFGPSPDASQRAMLRAVNDEDERVRGAAIVAVGFMLSKSEIDRPELRRAIAKALIDPSMHIRELAIYAFWTSAQTSPAFTIALLRDEDVRVRRGALTALARNEILVGKCIPELTAALADPDAGVRSGAAMAFANYGNGRNYQILPPPTISALEQARGDQDDAVREAATKALWREP